MNDMILTPHVPQYWENLYVEGKDTWSLGKATPALLDFFESPLCPKNGDVLVPAAGKGWDADAWAKRGHNVLAVDFCPSAVDAMEMLAKKNERLDVLNLDIFSLSPRNEKRGGKKFDIIYDYCGFNSIHPGRRDECVEMWMDMIKDDGLIIGFFYPLADKVQDQIPPYGIAENELLARFKGIIEIEQRFTPKKSVKNRIGKEEIWLLRKVL